MKVTFNHIGYLPNQDKHMYRIFCENGHADVVFEQEYLKPGTVLDLDSRLWTEHSGWADLKCDKCQTEYRERVYWGMAVRCPMCDTTETIPNGAILEVDNYGDI